MPSFPLFTSIKPVASADELSYLRDCLDSWRAAGFDTVAVNGPSEIAVLRKLDLPVEFVPSPTDGKPRIGVLLSAIRESGAPFAGIANSDCRIGEWPNPNLHGRCVLAWRRDATTGTPYPYGFDAFFFDTSIMPADDAGFSIGEPWWDFWFPYACKENGARVHALGQPILLHRAHKANWDKSQWFANGRRFWALVGKTGTPSNSDLDAIALAFPRSLHGINFRTGSLIIVSQSLRRWARSNVLIRAIIRLLTE